MSNVLLRVTNLGKVYFSLKNQKITALEEISLDIYKGEILSLLGVNGAGKTTFSSLVASMHPPTSGSIEWQGQSIYDNLYKYRSIIGFCPQRQNLDAVLTLEQNLIFAGRYFGLSKADSIKRKEHLLDQFELREYAQSKSDILSGGYQQRFLIARTLMHSPQLMILDEPTVGLDPQARRHLWEYISSLKQQGITIILTTHYLDEAEALSDRVCLIDRGKIKIIDTPENLKKAFEKKNLEEVFLLLVKEEVDHE